MKWPYILICVLFISYVFINHVYCHTFSNSATTKTAIPLTTKDNFDQSSSEKVAENKYAENDYLPYNYGQQCSVNINSDILNNKDLEILKDIYNKINNLTTLEEQNIYKLNSLENKLTNINNYLNKKKENIANTESIDMKAPITENESTNSIKKNMDDFRTSIENLDQSINVIQSDIRYIKNLIEFNKNIKEDFNSNLTNNQLNEGKDEGTECKDDYPKDCFDLYFTKGVRSSGIYRIKPLLKQFNVYCDMITDGGGWTMIQNRFDGSVDFYRNWFNYTNGFGQFGENHEFWLGLENIHQLTYNLESKLRIDFEDFDNNLGYAVYSYFYIGNEREFYKLHSLGDFIGNAGDSLRSHLGCKFTTYDNDQDNSGGNCAKSFTGAWWYKNCHQSNLNGQYLTGEITPDLHYKGITWNGFIDGTKSSLKKTRLMLRRRI